MSGIGITLGVLAEPWKNFKTIMVYDESGIENVIEDFNENKPYEMYNLKGLKVNENTTDGLTPGIYIRKQGEKIEKFVIK